MHTEISNSLFYKIFIRCYALILELTFPPIFRILHLWITFRRVGEALRAFAEPLLARCSARSRASVQSTLQDQSGHALRDIWILRFREV